MSTATAAQQTTAQLTAQFIRSIKDVLQTMANVTVEIGTPKLKTDHAATYDVSGIIGFSGEFKGSMVLSFQQSAAESIVARFAGMPIDPKSPDFPDAVGELANMVAGAAKTSFQGTTISVPSIVMGKSHTIARLQDVPCIIIPCKTADGEFAVEVNIKMQTKA